MADNLYEGMFLLDSSRFATNPDGLTGELLGILEKSGATVVAHRPWLDGRLAYSIEGHRKGLHYLTYFRMEGTSLKDVNRACKLSGNVIRHLVIKQPQVLFDAMVEALGRHESTSGNEEAETEGKSSRRKSDNSDDEEE